MTFVIDNGILKYGQIELLIIIRTETHSTVYAALSDVLGDASYVYPRPPGDGPFSLKCEFQGGYTLVW